LELTVVLPCAGAGTRLGLSAPKELYEIWPGVRLIDFSLNHIRQILKNQPGWKIRAAAVIRPGKEEVYRYVKQYLPETEVVPVRFNENYYEWAGSVFSAEEAYSDCNIVLLPDCAFSLSSSNYLQSSSGAGLIEQMALRLEKAPIVFAWMPCREPAMLAGLGALTVRDGLVTDLQDKPDQDREKYNAFWGSYGFQKQSAELIYRFFSASIRHEDAKQWKGNLFPAPGVELFEFQDLGTWDSIKHFRKKYKSVNDFLSAAG
jgi:hypothetical protein